MIYSLYETASETQLYKMRMRIKLKCWFFEFNIYWIRQNKSFSFFYCILFFFYFLIFGMYQNSIYVSIYINWILSVSSNDWWIFWSLFLHSPWQMKFNVLLNTLHLPFLSSIWHFMNSLKMFAIINSLMRFSRKKTHLHRIFMALHEMSRLFCLLYIFFFWFCIPAMCWSPSDFYHMKI